MSRRSAAQLPIAASIVWTPLSGTSGSSAATAAPSAVASAEGSPAARSTTCIEGGALPVPAGNWA